MQPCSCRWVVWVCFLQGAVGAELRGASASHPKNKCEAVRIGPHTAQSSAYCLLQSPETGRWALLEVEPSGGGGRDGSVLPASTGFGCCT